MRAIDADKIVYSWQIDVDGQEYDGITLQSIIDKMPTIEPEPKKGKWIVHPEVKNVYGGTYIECSQCGEKYVVQHMEDEKYCRNCGAKMEE